MPAAGRGVELPLELTSFVGRERELATTRDLLGRFRCLTITGVGGCGKTRLALELAARLREEFQAGAAFVDLAPISQPRGVAQTVAEAIGVVAGARRSAEDGLVLGLRDAHLLLVLDNCEHLVEGCAALVDTLLKRCPDVRVLATSRQPLDLPGEASFPLSPLPLPDRDARIGVDELASFGAVRLFSERAASMRPDFVLDERNVQAVLSICRTLDGLPLAIELAAARIRSLAPGEIQQRLEAGISVLSTGPRTAGTRHQTLRATIDWSHELLSDPERVLFRRLAVFSGGWTLDDAEGVCAFDPLPGDILDLHHGLVEKSLVAADSSHVSTRYRFLETIRRYAVERLLDSAEQEAMRKRHFTCFLARAERYDDERTLNGSDAGLTALARERENLRTALVWGLEADPAGALRLTAALDDFWHMVNPAEGWQWLQRTLERTDARSAHRTRALLVAGKLAGYVRAYAEGAGLLREARAMAETAGDVLTSAASLLWLGRLAIFAEDVASAEDHLTEALKQMEALGNPLGRVRALALLGLLHAVILDRRDEGVPELSSAADLAQIVDDNWGQGYAHMMLSICAADAKDAPAAQRHALRAVETPSIAPLHGVALQQIARVVVEQDPGRSLRLLGAAASMFERDGTDEPAFLARRADVARERAERLVGDASARLHFEEGRNLVPGEVFELVRDESGQQRLPGGLSRRELQVAALVAREQSNRDIAQALFISVRTAESHIEHILAKLSLANRRELAAWARGNGLVSEEPAAIR